MKIAVDFDAVLADLNTEWCRVYNELHNDDLSLERILCWDTHKYVKLDVGLGYYDLRTPELYRSVQPVSGALWFMEMLPIMGFEAHVVSHDTPEFLVEKRAWLDRYGLDYVPLNIEKDKVAAMVRHNLSILVDDGPHNAIAVGDVGLPVLLFDNHGTYKYNQHPQYTNRYSATVVRVHTFAEALEEIVRYRNALHGEATVGSAV